MVMKKLSGCTQMGPRRKRITRRALDMRSSYSLINGHFFSSLACTVQIRTLELCTRLGVIRYVYMPPRRVEIDDSFARPHPNFCMMYFDDVDGK
jgi:hypothetical protein